MPFKIDPWEIIKAAFMVIKMLLKIVVTTAPWWLWVLIVLAIMVQVLVIKTKRKTIKR